MSKSDILTENQFVDNVTQWITERNFLTDSTPNQQFYKLVSEAGEFAQAVSDFDVPGMLDGLGDTDVVAVNMLRQFGADPHEQTNRKRRPLLAILGDLGDSLAKSEREASIVLLLDLRQQIKREAQDRQLDIRRCWFVAWKEIKDRKGYMKNGTYIKVPVS